MLLYYCILTPIRDLRSPLEGKPEELVFFVFLCFGATMSVSSEKCWTTPGVPALFRSYCFMLKPTERHLLLSQMLITGQAIAVRVSSTPTSQRSALLGSEPRTVSWDVAFPNHPTVMDVLSCDASILIFETPSSLWLYVLCGQESVIFSKLCGYGSNPLPAQLLMA